MKPLSSIAKAAPIDSSFLRSFQLPGLFTTTLLILSVQRLHSFIGLLLGFPLWHPSAHSSRTRLRQQATFCSRSSLGYSDTENSVLLKNFSIQNHPLVGSLEPSALANPVSSSPSRTFHTVFMWELLMLLPERECSLPFSPTAKSCLSLLKMKSVVHFFYKRMCVFFPFLKSYTRNNRLMGKNRVRNQRLKIYVTLQLEH